MLISKRILFFALVLLCRPLSGQDSSWKERLSVEGNYQYGFLLPHSKFMAYFVEEHIQGFQVNCGIKTSGTKSWHQHYNYPTLGVGFAYSGLSNPKVYGNLHAVYGFIKRDYLKPSSRINIGNRFEFGLGYVSKKFDLYKNPLDMAVSSNWNVYIHYDLYTKIAVTKNIDFNLGVGLTHLSNGNFGQPNKGFNICTALAGFEYCLDKTPHPSRVETLPDSSRSQVLVSALYGRKQVSRYSPTIYSVSGISLEYAYRISSANWIGTALSFYHDPSLRNQIGEGDTAKYLAADPLRITLNLSYELKMGKLSFVFQPGIYLKNAYKTDGNISNRLAIRYMVRQNLVGSITIKAHWFAIADFIEWGIGYRWGSKSHSKSITY